MSTGLRASQHMRYVTRHDNAGDDGDARTSRRPTLECCTRRGTTTETPTTCASRPPFPQEVCHAQAGVAYQEAFALCTR